MEIQELVGLNRGAIEGLSRCAISFRTCLSRSSVEAISGGSLGAPVMCAIIRSSTRSAGRALLRSFPLR